MAFLNNIQNFNPYYHQHHAYTHGLGYIWLASLAILHLLTNNHSVLVQTFD